jgi:hypothetical protein
MSPVAIAEVSEPEAATPSRGSTAPSLSGRTVTLRFRVVSTGHRGLEALRYARRAMLREEWTRGVVEGEPSLEEAVFTASDVSWTVPSEAVGASRAKLEELVARANRALVEMASAPRTERHA